MAARTHDIVVHGATGFVGKLTARYLAGAAPRGTRIALSGRSRERLDGVRNVLGVDWPVVVADAADPVAMAGLAESATVVASCVGPYNKYGRPLAEACAAAGAHHADLTGEASFVRWCADTVDGPARASGAKVVSSCGYDSIPSDLGMWMLAQEAGEVAEAVLVAKARGGVSGGTIDTMRGEIAAATAGGAGRALLTDPYSLSPDRAGEADLGRQLDAFPPRRDPLTGQWSAPFVMGPYNSRIVRRSNALTGWSYGRDLRYREVMSFGTAPTGALTAAAVTGGLAAGVAAMAFGPTRGLLDRVLPKPGEGPSERVMEGGHFRSDIYARTVSGDRWHAVVAGDGDPGYKATALMFGESALCLALDDLPAGGGVLTTATAMGGRLLDRLRAAGFTATVERDGQ